MVNNIAIRWHQFNLTVRVIVYEQQKTFLFFLPISSAIDEKSILICMCCNVDGRKMIQRNKLFRIEVNIFGPSLLFTKKFRNVVNLNYYI